MRARSRYRSRLWRRRARHEVPLLATLAAILLAACGGAALTPPATPAPTPRPSLLPSLERDYLALGESITFGYVAHPSPIPGGGNPYSNASNFAAYPAFVGQTLGLQAINASCPGETSGSFLAAGAPDNGCHAFRAAFPLHVSYPGQSQMQFADAFIKSHSIATQLVTIEIGGNDGLLAIDHCGGLDNATCIDQQVGPTVSTLKANLTTIVQSIRADGFNDTIVLLNFYALNYASTEQTQLIGQLNAAIADVVSANHLQLADVYGAFQRAAGRTGGNTCATGLLAAGSSALGACDLHPSLGGQQLIATTVEQATIQ